MNSTTNQTATALHIWQQNLNTSHAAQHSLLNNIKPKEWEIIALQEPHINFLNLTISNRQYHTLYPTPHRTEGAPRSRAITLISTHIATESWCQIPFPSSDVVVVQLKGPYGLCTIYNIYNDGESQRTITALDKHLEENIQTIKPSENDHMLWLGDFNRHHPMWEEERNAHLLTNSYLDAAEPLLLLLAEHGMQQALPKDMPTLQALASKNWTRPDNVFCTENTCQSFLHCYTEPRLRDCTDHVPILSILELEVPKTELPPRKNFRETDWESFNDALAVEMAKFPKNAPIVSDREFQAAAKGLTQAILTVIDEHVPISKPCPSSKRWWNHDLTALRKEVNRAAAETFKLRAFQDHPAHEAHRTLRNKYSEAIKKAKKEHWMDWLENATSNDVWTANRYLNAEPGDGGPSRVPTLKAKAPDGRQIEARTNEQKSDVLANQFFPPPPRSSSVPEDYEYPIPVDDVGTITKTQLLRSISKLSPYKAPGPDGIPNVVFKQCSEVLAPLLLRIFNASFLLKTYYQPWRDFTTVVLRKPGRPDYTIPKAYRPIALLNTTAKLLTAVVADQLSHLIETHHLLPANHFGGRPGRSTTDSLHLLEAIVKNAWRTKKVVSALFLDIEGAFPNAVTDRLLHNMRRRRIPEHIVTFTQRVLEGRRTRLIFDGHTSDWIDIINGIGQGDPLSMVLYIIYNADLVDVASGSKEHTLAFVDDAAFIVIANSTQEAHGILINMLERDGGGFEWAKDHNSRFETSKFALIDFTPQNKKERVPINIRGTIISPSQSHRFLGVIVDEALRWHAHVNYAVGKGTAYVMQLRRLLLPSKGIPLTLMRQLYTSVALPKMLYAADVWFTPLYSGTEDEITRGSKGAAKKLGKVQRLAMLSITGALRSTATDVLEAHAKIMPIEFRIQNHCHRAAVRLSSHPPSHPMHHLIKRAARRFVKRHKSSLHHLTHAFSIDPSSLETLQPARRPPNETVPYTTRIASNREESIKFHDDQREGTKIYCNGSGFNGGIGAAAVLIHPDGETKTLRYHLGDDKTHTVYESEAVGLLLAAHLLHEDLDLSLPISIYVDNQAAIKSGANPFATRPGHYLIDRFNRAMRGVAKANKIPRRSITINWISGHSGVDGNEKADEEAKKASEGPESSSPKRRLPTFLRKMSLPMSISACLQWQRKATHQRWERRWAKSPRFERINKIDAKLLAGSFVSLSAMLAKRRSSALIWLRSGHCPLNAYLKRITKSDTDKCPHCGDAKEDVLHYLLTCPHYARQRHILWTRTKRKTTNLSYLLADPKGMAHTLEYIDKTGRFKATLGDLSSTR